MAKHKTSLTQRVGAASAIGTTIGAAVGTIACPGIGTAAGTVAGALIGAAVPLVMKYGPRVVKSLKEKVAEQRQKLKALKAERVMAKEFDKSSIVLRKAGLFRESADGKSVSESQNNVIEALDLS